MYFLAHHLNMNIWSLLASSGTVVSLGQAVARREGTGLVASSFFYANLIHNSKPYTNYVSLGL